MVIWYIYCHCPECGNTEYDVYQSSTTLKPLTWSDMQIIFLQQCSALNALGIHLDATFICYTHPNVRSTGAQHSTSEGCPEVSDTKWWSLSESDTRWDWDLVNLEVRLSYFFTCPITEQFSHCCGVDCPTDGGTVFEVCTWSAVVFGWLLAIKVASALIPGLKVSHQHITL